MHIAFPYPLFYHLTFLSILGLLLTACGFQLRGQAQLPPAMAVTYIASNTPSSAPPSELERTLRLVLETNGVTVTDDSQAATATIAILGESESRRTLATGPNGEVREYTLNYIVDYAVRLADGAELIPKDTLRVSRDVLYDEAQVLGRAAGETITMRDMIYDVAYSIIRRLQAVNR